jgi:transposase InsO family protein
MALWTRRKEDVTSVVHHSDRGVQYLSIRYTERLAGAGAVTSVGSRGDSYDNALAESIIGLYKTTYPKARTLEKLRRCRGRYPGMSRLVQPPPALGTHRLHAAGGTRRHLLSWRSLGRGGRTQTIESPLNPGRFTGRQVLQWLGPDMVPGLGFSVASALSEWSRLRGFPGSVMASLGILWPRIALKGL